MLAKSRSGQGVKGIFLAKGVTLVRSGRTTAAKRRKQDFDLEDAQGKGLGQLQHFVLLAGAAWPAPELLQNIAVVEGLAASIAATVWRAWPVLLRATRSDLVYGRRTVRPLF